MHYFFIEYDDTIMAAPPDYVEAYRCRAPKLCYCSDCFAVQHNRMPACDEMSPPLTDDDAPVDTLPTTTRKVYIVNGSSAGAAALLRRRQNNKRGGNFNKFRNVILAIIIMITLAIAFVVTYLASRGIRTLILDDANNSNNNNDGNITDPFLSPNEVAARLAQQARLRALARHYFNEDSTVSAAPDAEAPAAHHLIHVPLDRIIERPQIALPEVASEQASAADDNKLEFPIFRFIIPLSNPIQPMTFLQRLRQHLLLAPLLEPTRVIGGGGNEQQQQQETPENDEMTWDEDESSTGNHQQESTPQPPPATRPVANFLNHMAPFFTVFRHNAQNVLKNDMEQAASNNEKKSLFAAPQRHDNLLNTHSDGPIPDKSAGNSPTTSPIGFPAKHDEIVHDNRSSLLSATLMAFNKNKTNPHAQN